MSITRWDPFRDMLSLREAMNQLLEQSFIHPGTAGSTEARGGPQGLALDIAERGDAYEVKASLPGVRPEDIQVTVRGDTLTIRAETRAEEGRREGNYLLRERRGGVLQRAISLPTPIAAEAVQADYEDGVLTLRLPKSRAGQPRRIEVRTGAGGGEQPQLAGQASGQSEAEAPTPPAQSQGRTRGRRRATPPRG